MRNALIALVFLLAAVAGGCRDKKTFITQTNNDTSTTTVFEIDGDYLDLECLCGHKYHVHRHGHADCKHGNKDEAEQ